jgi:hypothetical protein
VSPRADPLPDPATDQEHVPWDVTEATALPGSEHRGAICLLFTAPGMARRLGSFPATWWDLTDPEREARG